MPNRPIMAWGLTARPETAGDGDEYIDLSTGVHYVYQDGVWHDGAPTPIVVKDAEPTEPVEEPMPKKKRAAKKTAK